MLISGYRCMWIVTMFDLPVDTRKARRAYRQFRKSLLKDGFAQMQYSVYVRHCASEENADVHIQRVQAALPDDGEVRLLSVTDKQFARMRVFLGQNAQTDRATTASTRTFLTGFTSKFFADRGLRDWQCNRPKPASNPQQWDAMIEHVPKCNRPKPASNPQQRYAYSA